MLQTTQSWDGTNYKSYSTGQPQLTVLRIKVPPNTALHWHHHPVISVGYVLPGELKVEKRETGERTLVHAGQTLAETVQTKERYMKVKCGLTMVVQILAAAFMLPAIVLAQAPANPSAATETGGQLQQITVTGYVIPRIGQGPQPVVTYDRDYVDKLGYQTATDLIRALPFNNAALAPLTNSGINSSPASSAPNLRGLNVSSTLTLVDGHRFPDFPIPLGGTLSFVDLNSIPLAAIDRIEILKDGASAVYGDDAVAGVVNIILKDEYNGADIYNYYSVTDRGDAETYHGQFTAGRSTKLWSDDSKLSIVTAFDYFSSSPIESIDRSYAYGDKSKLAAKYPDTPTQFLPPAGSFLGQTTGTVYNVRERATANVASSFTTGAENTVNQPFIPFNSQLVGREERYGGIVKVKFEPTNWLKFYDTLLVQRSEENGVTPNQGLFSSSIAGDKVAGTQIFIPANNPFNPSRFFGTPEALTGRGQSFDEFGPWHETTITRTIFNVVGATLQLPHSWVVDASYTFGESDSTQTLTNAALNDRLQLALERTIAWAFRTIL